MADSMYESDGSAEPKEEESTPEDESGDETALLPVGFFSGKELEVGGKCQVEIVHIYGDEVEVKYVKHDKTEEPKPDSEPSMKDKIAMAAT